MALSNISYNIGLADPTLQLNPPWLSHLSQSHMMGPPRGESSLIAPVYDHICPLLLLIKAHPIVLLICESLTSLQTLTKLCNVSVQ